MTTSRHALKEQIHQQSGKISKLFLACIVYEELDPESEITRLLKWICDDDSAPGDWPGAMGEVKSIAGIPLKPSV